MAPKLEANRLSKWLSRVVVSRIIANSVCVCVCVLEIWPSGVEEKAISGVGARSLWPNNKYRPGPSSIIVVQQGESTLREEVLRRFYSFSSCSQPL